MWPVYRMARFVGIACLVLTAYLCFAFYNFEGDIERLRSRHVKHIISSTSHEHITRKGISGSHNTFRRELIVPGNLLEPHLLHLRVAHTVNTLLPSMIFFDNSHDPHEVEKLLTEYEAQLAYTFKKSDDLNETWKLADSWVNPNQGRIGPRQDVDEGSLGRVFYQLSYAEIISADVANKGTQLKLLLTLRGGQQAFFKPMFYPREFIIREGPFAGADRHNGEIVAFHLARLLSIYRTPLVAGRRILLDDIQRKSSPILNSTFYKEHNRTCFYGKCYYCKRDNGVCGDQLNYLEGAIVLMLPSKFHLQSRRSPWQRTYKDGVYARFG